MRARAGTYLHLRAHSQADKRGLRLKLRLPPALLRGHEVDVEHRRRGDSEQENKEGNQPLQESEPQELFLRHTRPPG